MEEKSVLLKVELDVTALKTSAKEAEERLGVLKPQMEALRKESGTGTLEYAKLKEEVKQYTKQLNDSAAAIQINEKLAVKNTQSNVELAQAQKALAVAYNNLTQDQRENTEEGRRITEQYKAINDALNENALSVSDGRRNVGLYAESIKKAYAELDVMKKQVNQIGYAMSSNQKELDKNTKALNDLAKSGDTTSAEYRSLQENVDFYTEAVQMNNATLNEANEELKQQEEQLAKTEKEARKVGFVYGQQEEQTKSLKAQLKELKAELATMDPNSEAFIEGSQRAGELADKIKDANDAVKAQTSGSGFEKLGNTFGMLKDDLTNLDFQGVAEKAKSLESIAKGMTFKEMIGGLKNMGSALVSLGKVILANPIFLIIAAIAAVVAAIVYFTSETETAEEANEKLNASLEKTRERLDAQNKEMLQGAKNRLRMAEATNQSEEVLLKRRLEVLASEKKARENDMNYALYANRQKSAMYKKALEEENYELAKKIREEIKANQTKYKDLANQNKQYFNEVKIENAKFNTKQAEDTQKANDEAQKKSREASEKYRQDRKNALAEIKKAEDEFNLSDTELAIKESRRKYGELIAQAQKYKQETATLRKALEAEISEINKKATDDEKAKKDEQIKIAQDAALKQAEAYIKAQDEVDALLAKFDPEIAILQKFEKTQIELDKLLQSGAISQEKYNELTKTETEKTQTEIVNINKEKNDKIQKDNEEQAKEDLASFQAAVDLVAGISSDLISKLSALRKNQVDAELQQNQTLFEVNTASLDAQLQSQLISQEKYNQDKAQLEKEYKAKEKQIRTEEFKKQKQASVLEATINTAVAITKALPNVALALLAGVLGGIEIAAIAGQPIPEFATGGVVSGKLITSGDGKSITRANGDNLLATVRTGEVILNEAQQNALGGAQTFARIGVPGFANGGVAVASGTIADSNVSNFNQQAQMREFLLSMPKPVVIVQDIVEGVNNAMSVQNAADI
jgi:hypothetical protein